MVSTTGSNPDTDNVSPVIWGTTNSNHNVGQILSQLAKPDPMHVYFKLKAPTTTNLTIQKVCEDGNIGGITFTLDRPFLFAVYGEDNLPLFVGIVNRP